MLIIFKQARIIENNFVPKTKMVHYYKFIISLLIIGLFGISFQQAYSQSADTTDTKISLSTWNKLENGINKGSTSKLYQMTYIGVPLIVGGLIIKNESYHFHDLRNDYIPSFRYHYDDYLQYAPAAVMLGLKAAGVKGRSSWGRMLTSDVFSVALMAATVNLLKSTIDVARPDGSGHNSFPSGHTATAFMTATMLHKEYGLTRSPWYSIGAYSAATVTAISRQLNNKHWMSDVLTGAGIGILSTELGYYFADMIFKKKGLLMDNLAERPYDKRYKPSFFGLYLGFNLSPGTIDIAPDLQLKTATGSCSGFEGAWFMNRYIGLGGRATISGNPITFDQATYVYWHPEYSGKTISVESGSINTYSAMAGLFFSLPITNRWQAGSKLLAGYSHWRDNTLSILTGEPNTIIERKEILKIKKAFNPTIGTGISLMYIVRQSLGVRFFCDYNLSSTRQEYILPNKYNNDSHQLFHIFTLGAAVNILFLKK